MMNKERQKLIDLSTCWSHAQIRGKAKHTVVLSLSLHDRDGYSSFWCIAGQR